jgi:para-nitrobenzyl esterase
MSEMKRMADAGSPEVRTGSGLVRGLRDEGLCVFRGVPYGSLEPGRRFQLPQPPQPWTDVRDAVEYGPQAIQIPYAGPPMPAVFWGKETMAEDCLTLNVWSPGLDGERRPVMVWLHPGGFSAGSASAPLTDGGNLARRGDVVVVSLNHRLNIFGYLYLAELGGSAYADSGNAGQFDQLLALQWVQANIAAFGGDPDNVTLFGESGGGCKIAALMTMPQAQGLFHKGIMESGPMMKGVEPRTATAAARLVMASLGISEGDVAKLETVPAEALLKAYGDAVGAGHFGTFSPVTDGRGLPHEPFIPHAPAGADGVSLLVGFNATETTFLLGSPDSFALDWEKLPMALAPFLGPQSAFVIQSYRASRPHATASETFFSITTQMMIHRNSVLIADRKAVQRAPVYMYELMWRTPIAGGCFGSPHSLEIPLVFDNVEVARDLVGGGDEPQRLADQMSSAWIAFARTGDPAVSAAPKWPRYEPSSRWTMMFDVESKVLADPTGELSLPLREVPLWHCTG